MHDPFPIPPPESLQKLIQPFADYFSLHTLPLHFHEVLIAAVLYHVTNKFISPAFSRFCFPRIYPNFNERTKLNWDVHVVSFVQSTLINVLALWVIWTDQERADMNWQGKVWGYTGASGLIQAFAGGYFLWDLFITLRNINIFGLGMLAHAVSALFVFSLGFRPFLNFYGPTFILYELSSPFLNIHWFCDKLNMTGTKVQLYNGIMLLFTFFSCRLLWGSYQSVRVFNDVYRAINSGAGTLHDPELGKLNNGTVVPDSPIPESEIMRFAGDRVVPLWLAVAYLASNIILNGLNWFWFGKMIETIRKRFDPPLGTRKAEKKIEIEEKEPVLVEGINVTSHPSTPAPGMTGVDYVSAVHVDKDGGHTLQVGQTEVRSRTARKSSDQAVAA
ncbi:TLC domain-containing protein [Lophiotrema nucula]|uniref:TLC domain-containing protein n=1 Tax=Lophiotrema nucula TaxID=690887 RepID=A0A6A5ZCW6_9PLEO|nr:TLC domain-containing protein [Lophiotrema nucula]